MVKFLGVSRQIAALVTPDTYPLGVSRVRMQRVVTLMGQFGLLKHSFNIAVMTGANP